MLVYLRQQFVLLSQRYKQRNRFTEKSHDLDWISNEFVLRVAYKLMTKGEQNKQSTKAHSRELEIRDKANHHQNKCSFSFWHTSRLSDSGKCFATRFNSMCQSTFILNAIENRVFTIQMHITTNFIAIRHIYLPLSSYMHELLMFTLLYHRVCVCVYVCMCADNWNPRNVFVSETLTSCIIHI